MWQKNVFVSSCHFISVWDNTGQLIFSEIILAGDSFSVSKSGRESSICHLWRNFGILTASIVRTPNMYQAAVLAHFSRKLRKYYCPRAFLIESHIHSTLWKQAGESVLINIFVSQAKRVFAISLRQSKLLNQNNDLLLHNWFDPSIAY